MVNQIGDPDIPERLERFIAFVREPLWLKEMSTFELLGINHTSRINAAIHLERQRQTDLEILRRDAAGVSLECEDFDTQIVPDSASPTETSVITRYKPDRDPWRRES